MLIEFVASAPLVDPGVVVRQALLSLRRCLRLPLAASAAPPTHRDRYRFLWLQQVAAVSLVFLPPALIVVGVTSFHNNFVVGKTKPSDERNDHSS